MIALRHRCHAVTVPGVETMLVPDQALVRSLPFALKSCQVIHGGLPLTLLVGRIG